VRDLRFDSRQREAKLSSSDQVNPLPPIRNQSDSVP
jgi:hypothetical protein